MELYFSNAFHISTNSLSDQSERLEIKHPDYTQRIDPKQMRRMSDLVKMGIFSALSLLDDSKVFDGPLICGTGLGCIQDTFSFMKNLYERDEQMLSPTHFIQSTHNTVAGTAGILLRDHNYNITWSQRFHTFYFCLEDAWLRLHDNQSSKVLILLVDEISQEINEIVKNMECLNPSDVWTGGCASFIVSDQRIHESDRELKDFKIFPTNQLTNLNFPPDIPIYFMNTEKKYVREGWTDLSNQIGKNFVMDAIAMAYCIEKESNGFILIGGDHRHCTLFQLVK